MKSRIGAACRLPPIVDEPVTRRAYTLVELLLVVSLATVVLSTLGVLLHGAWRVERTMTNHRQFVDTLDRLAQQFRTDIHQATSVRIGTAAQSGGKSAPFIVAMSNEEAEYSLGQATVSRIVRREGNIVARETFQLPDGGDIRWEISPGGGAKQRQVASLLISYPLVSTARDLSDKRNLRVDAAIGLSPTEFSLAGGAR
jgi:hypothetical protein